MSILHKWLSVLSSRRYREASLLLCVVLGSPVLAASPEKPRNIAFVVSKASSAYEQVVSLAESNLLEQNNQYSFVTLLQGAESDIDRALETADLIVTVGAGATQRVVSKEPSQPIIAALITDSAFSAIAQQYYGSKAQALAAGLSVICLDQPVKRSIQLSKLLVPSASNIGLMLGPASLSKFEEFERHVTEAGLEPILVNVNARDNPIKALEPIIKRSDVFIPVPDSRLINIATAKWILQLSYRYKVPVVAYSKAYLNAGALAAVYTSPENVAQQVSELIAKHGGETFDSGAAHMPAYFSVEFNTNVAEHLDIRLEDKQFYLDRLKN
ncbi:MAG: ABC transporter substrate-binding protein [Porticoccaceae bacterium]